MYPNSSSEEIYELVSDEIYISKFEVSYDELIGKWVVYFVLKNNTDKDIPLDDYLVLVYGNNGKILREYYKGLNPVINAKKENKYTYILSFDGSLVEKVEIVKNSEYLFDQENYG